MTVLEYLDKYKKRHNMSSRKLNKIWFCPDLVTKPKMGKDYAFEISSNSAIPDTLKDTEVTKHWIESDILCLVYKNSEEIQASLA